MLTSKSRRKLRRNRRQRKHTRRKARKETRKELQQKQKSKAHTRAKLQRVPRVILRTKGVRQAEDLVNLFVNNGVAVAVIVYFMYRDFRFYDSLQKTLQTLVTTVDTLKATISNSKDKGVKKC